MNANGFRLLLNFLLLAGPLAFACPADEQVAALATQEAKASILTQSEDIIVFDEIRKLAPGAKVEQSGDLAKGPIYTVTWDEAQVIVNTHKEGYEQKTQNEGAVGWISTLPEDQRRGEAVERLLAFLPKVKKTYGIVLPKGFDTKGMATGFLIRLTKDRGGYAFTNNSFYDTEGFRVTGNAMDPAFLGPMGKSMLLMDNPPGLAELMLGTWEVRTTMSMRTENATMTVVGNSVDDFGADGVWRSEGTLEFLIIPDGSDTGFKMSMKCKLKATWEVKDGAIWSTPVEITTTDHQVDFPELMEILKEMDEELQKDKKAEKSFVVARDRDLLIMQDHEMPMSSQMRRKVDPAPSGR
jgi:hypothetical protein